MCLTYLWVFSLCAWFMAARALKAQLYPAVLPVTQLFNIPDIHEANVILDLKAKSGATLYRLQCHSAGYTGDPDFDYSGDFECRLGMVGHNSSYSTLLTENTNQSRDWESRGRFFAANLQGECARIPEFGALRSFQLRGMNLSLHIVDPTFSNGKLHSLKLVIAVRSDLRAKRPVAKAVLLPATKTAASCKLPQYFVNPLSLPQINSPSRSSAKTGNR